MTKKKLNKYFYLVLLLIIVVVALFVVKQSSTDTNSSTDNKTYTLDTTEIIETEPYFGGPRREMPWGISHNAVVAFPIDLSQNYKKVQKTEPSTVVQVQTKAVCLNEENEFYLYNRSRPDLTDDEIKRIIEHSKNTSLNYLFSLEETVIIKDTVNIRKIRIEMPYDTTPSRCTWIRDECVSAETFCIGFHTKDRGLIWDLTPIGIESNSNLRVNFAEISVDENNVDMVALLFDRGTQINKIIFKTE